MSIKLLIILFCLLSSIAAADYPNKKSPICIIGAGISGLSLGNLLEGKGHAVTLFEKSGVVGGKIGTFRRGDEIQVETCPVVYSPWNDSILKYINQFHLTSVPWNNSDSAHFEPNSGQLFQSPTLTDEQKGQLLDAAKRYSQLQAQYVANGALDFGFVKASKFPELFDPTSQWMDDRNLAILKPIFRVLITSEGYGDLEQTPALYILRFVDQSFLINIALNPRGGFLTLKEGLDVLVNKMSQNLTIKLNQKVVQIDRTEWAKNYQVSLTTTKNGPDGGGGRSRISVYKCAQVILAFPPVLRDVENVVKDLTPDEKSVLGQVKIHKYTSAAHHIPAMDKTAYTSLATHAVSEGPGQALMGHGEVVIFVRQSLKKLKNVYSSYSWIRGDFTEIASETELALIEDKLEGTLEKINLNSARGNNNKRATVILRPRQKLPYFPHVNCTSLKDGFYEKFDKIQSANGLYYATTLLTFEDMDFALKMTEDFVNRYF